MFAIFYVEVVQLVKRLFWEQEVVGSSPTFYTRGIKGFGVSPCNYLLPKARMEKPLKK